MMRKTPSNWANQILFLWFGLMSCHLFYSSMTDAHNPFNLIPSLSLFILFFFASAWSDHKRIFHLALSYGFTLIAVTLDSFYVDEWMQKQTKNIALLLFLCSTLYFRMMKFSPSSKTNDQLNKIVVVFVLIGICIAIRQEIDFRQKDILIAIEHSNH